MIKLKHLLEVEAISLVSIAAVVSMVIVIHNNQNNQPNLHVLTPIVENNNAQADTLPTVTPVPQEDVTSQISPNGAKKVVLKTTHNSDGTVTFNLSTTDGSGQNEQQVYSVILQASETMSIPFNTWSPDNKYFFVVKDSKDVMVFKASGETFADGAAYLDATDAFNQKNIDNTLTEATGWASETLIILNTTTADNQKGPSYWFEVPSKAIIRLSTEF
ncbi:MAG TPA: hypothetical protein VLG12_03080 [Candidatus Saccharimonadales bacterium]|nr:hypothetical protein [Candidatus Saccharimonadales bacterium]